MNDELYSLIGNIAICIVILLSLVIGGLSGLLLAVVGISSIPLVELKIFGVET